MEKKYLVAVESARNAAVHALKDRGVSSVDAADIVEVLLETSLLGVETHGLRLLGTYLDEISRGISKVSPEYTVSQRYGPSYLSGCR